MRLREPDNTVKTANRTVNCLSLSYINRLNCRSVINFNAQNVFILQIVRGYMDQLKDKIEEETGGANEAEEEAKVWNTHLHLQNRLCTNLF